MLELYEQEKLDGINFAQSLSIAYTLDLSLLKDETLAEVGKCVAMANKLDQPDLFYMDSILATLGWNLNDDIFLKSEVVAAKNTPVDKPFNKMHNQEDIIGHMTSSRLLDSDYNTSSDDDFEHIAVSSVIYRAWRDEEKKKDIDKTIAEILEGKWKVSMECLFDKFDYGLIKPDGSQIIIARTPETSHLTKYLRAYKGPGVVKDYRIGRVLRNITFCGKGLVDQPGNPYSIIFNSKIKFFGAKASLKELRMNELETAQAELKAIKTELESAKAEAQKVAEAKHQTAIAEKDTVIKEKDEAIANLREDLKKVNQALADAKTNLDNVETIKAEAIKGFESAKAELDKIKSDAAVASRKAALAAIKGMDTERAESLLAKFASASDEMFNELVSTLAGLPPWMDKDKEKDKDEDKKKKDAEAEKKMAECKKDEKEEVKADLAKAELDKHVDGHAEAARTNDAMDSIVKYLSQHSKNKPFETVKEKK